MAQPNLAELTAAAAAAKEPGFPSASVSRPGGVDPLGLRQINFNLMDKVFPGLNNVARYIRPFVVVTWAWRRAHQLAQESGVPHIKKDELLDFVDRMEVLYVASQVLRNAEADLPGRQYLASLLREKVFNFGGPHWQQRRKARRYSTAISAPVNYGPGLKMLGWVVPHPEHAAVMLPNPAVSLALDAFESRITGFLDHEAFNAFGPVTVMRGDVGEWADAWPLDSVTAEEARVMGSLLFGSAAPRERRLGMELMQGAAAHVAGTNADAIRAAMSGPPSDFNPPAHLIDTRDAWRRLQVRQLFRLVLEALFYWTLVHLEGRSSSIHSLVKAFLNQAPPSPGVANARRWLASLVSPSAGPTELITEIRRELDNPTGGGLAQSIAIGLAFSLAESSRSAPQEERTDRLPLSRAFQEADVRGDSSVPKFTRHVLESWILAQHAYWSVGRGLADARTSDRLLLRLRVTLDEGGWTLTPGASRGKPPRPTRDRLQTAITLATECGLLATDSVRDRSRVSGTGPATVSVNDGRPNGRR